MYPPGIPNIAPQAGGAVNNQPATNNQTAVNNQTGHLTIYQRFNRARQQALDTFHNLGGNIGRFASRFKVEIPSPRGIRNLFRGGNRNINFDAESDNTKQLALDDSPASGNRSPSMFGNSTIAAPFSPKPNQKAPKPPAKTPNLEILQSTAHRNKSKDPIAEANPASKPLKNTSATTGGSPKPNARAKPKQKDQISDEEINQILTSKGNKDSNPKQQPQPPRKQ